MDVQLSKNSILRHEPYFQKSWVTIEARYWLATLGAVSEKRSCARLINNKPYSTWDTLLQKKLKGNKQTRVREKMTRARNIAVAVYDRFQVGPYQYQTKHLHWYLQIQTKELKPTTRYRYWLATKSIITALGKEDEWLGHLKGDWMNSD